MSLFSAKELSDINQRYYSLCIYALLVFAILLFLSYGIPITQLIYAQNTSDWLTLASCAIILFVFIVCSFGIYQSKIPKKELGFTKPTAKAISETAFFSIIFCIAGFLVKLLLVTYVTAVEKYPLFLVEEPHILKEAILMLIMYCLFVPFQVFIFHCSVQSPFIYLVHTKHKAILNIVYSLLIFCAAHCLISYSYAILVFLPGLIWMILYYHHRNFYTIVLSHIIVGGFLLCIMGVTPFLVLIQNYIL